MRFRVRSMMAAFALLSCRGREATPQQAQGPAAPATAQAMPIAYSDSAIGARATDPVADSASKFTEAFYAWYAAREYRLQSAVRARPDVFGSELLQALRLDLAAAAKHPGEIVGLDWEPFSGSQDPCGPFRATRVSRRADTVLVAMRGMCADAAPRFAPDAVPELLRVGGQWRVVNIRHGGDSGTLLEDLARLRRERDSTSARGRS
jgi:hypothetical protein